MALDAFCNLNFSKFQLPAMRITSVKRVMSVMWVNSVILVNMSNANMFSTIGNIHCVKSFRIQRFSSAYFPVFGLNTGRYGVSLCIQSKCEKIRTRKLQIRTVFTR